VAWADFGRSNELFGLARFKRPKLYRFVEELPKNNYGKVLKTGLRRMLEEETA